MDERREWEGCRLPHWRRFDQTIWEDVSLVELLVMLVKRVLCQCKESLRELVRGWVTLMLLRQGLVRLGGCGRITLKLPSA